MSQRMRYQIGMITFTVFSFFETNIDSRTYSLRHPISRVSIRSSARWCAIRGRSRDAYDRVDHDIAMPGAKADRAGAASVKVKTRSKEWRVNTLVKTRRTQISPEALGYVPRRRTGGARKNVSSCCREREGRMFRDGSRVTAQREASGSGGGVRR